jgi:SNF family Na+-dependent transporter
MTLDRAQRLFLLVFGVGLVPVALSYGAMPEHSLTRLYGLGELDVTTRHVFRAIMGLYLAMIVFWLAGALRPALRIPALWSAFVFVTGIALGRGLSIGVDGWPHPLMVLYLIVEIMLAATSLSLIVGASQNTI